MRALICGDRNWSDQWAVQSIVWGLCCSGHKDPCDTIIEGDARGADRMAGEACRGYDDIELLVYPADWEKYHKGAGPVRNQQMLTEGKPDVVFAFHDDIASSKGTRDMCERARRAGLPVYVVGRYKP